MWRIFCISQIIANPIIAKQQKYTHILTTNIYLQYHFVQRICCYRVVIFSFGHSYIRWEKRRDADVYMHVKLFWKRISAHIENHFQWIFAYYLLIINMRIVSSEFLAFSRLCMFSYKDVDCCCNKLQRLIIHVTVGVFMFCVMKSTQGTFVLISFEF